MARGVRVQKRIIRLVHDADSALAEILDNFAMTSTELFLIKRAREELVDLKRVIICEEGKESNRGR